MSDLYTDPSGNVVQVNQVASSTVDQVALVCGGFKVTEVDPDDINKKYFAVNVPTKEGMQRASDGDYVVKIYDGTYTVIKENVFLTAGYKAVNAKANKEIHRDTDRRRYSYSAQEEYK